MTQGVGNEPRDSLKGTDEGLFIRVIPSFLAAEQQQESVADDASPNQGLPKSVVLREIRGSVGNMYVPRIILVWTRSLRSNLPVLFWIPRVFSPMHDTKPLTAKSIQRCMFPKSPEGPSTF